MIFLDNASTTQVSEECAAIVKDYMLNSYFNPSAPYHPSVEISNQMNKWRESILRVLNGDGKFIFTSSGTESDNIALFGTKKPKCSKIIVSAAEHPAVYRCAEELKQRGYEVLYAEVDSGGRVIEDKFIQAIDDNTALVSIMHVNNETGAINDIKNLCKLAKEKNNRIIFHSDGVQAVGKIKFSINDLGVDLYSVSSHKIHAPKGCGGLFIRKGINLRPIIYGGGQEYNVRSSTENIPCIAGFSYSLQKAIEKIDEHLIQAKNCNKILRDELSKYSDQYRIISNEDASPYILSFALKFVRGEVMLHSLEKYGIYVGTGSACSNNKSERNRHKFFNLPPEYEKGVIRVSLSHKTTVNEIYNFINYLNLEYSQLVKYMKG